MKFQECIDGTASSDVTGVPQRAGVVRRRLPASYIKILGVKKKKKKKKDHSVKNKK